VQKSTLIPNGTSKITSKSTSIVGFNRYTFVGSSWRQTSVGSSNDFNSIIWNGSAWIEI
jgi:hypothetical protein